MASGMRPYWADVVQVELLGRLCPGEYKRFTDALLEVDISEWELHQAWHSGEKSLPDPEGKDDPEKHTDNPYRALRALIKTFRFKTGSLELDICFHDPNNGDRYDQVSGLFFTVDGVYQYTPAGEKFKRFIERKGWVEYG